MDGWMDGWAGPIIIYLDFSFENEDIIKLKGQQNTFIGRKYQRSA